MTLYPFLIVNNVTFLLVVMYPQHDTHRLVPFPRVINRAFPVFLFNNNPFGFYTILNSNHVVQPTNSPFLSSVEQRMRYLLYGIISYH